MFSFDIKGDDVAGLRMNKEHAKDLRYLFGNLSEDNRSGLEQIIKVCALNRDTVERDEIEEESLRKRVDNSRINSYVEIGFEPDEKEGQLIIEGRSYKKIFTSLWEKIRP